MGDAQINDLEMSSFIDHNDFEGIKSQTAWFLGDDTATKNKNSTKQHQNGVKPPPQTLTSPSSI